MVTQLYQQHYDYTINVSCLVLLLLRVITITYRSNDANSRPEIVSSSHTAVAVSHVDLLERVPNMAMTPGGFRPFDPQKCLRYDVSNRYPPVPSVTGLRNNGRPRRSLVTTLSIIANEGRLNECPRYILHRDMSTSSTSSYNNKPTTVRTQMHVFRKLAHPHQLSSRPASPSLAISCWSNLHTAKVTSRLLRVGFLAQQQKDLHAARGQPQSDGEDGKSQHRRGQLGDLWSKQIVRKGTSRRTYPCCWLRYKMPV
jgi:hypothetical protein